MGCAIEDDLQNFTYYGALARVGWGVGVRGSEKSKTHFKYIEKRRVGEDLPGTGCVRWKVLTPLRPVAPNQTRHLYPCTCLH